MGGSILARGVSSDTHPFVEKLRYIDRLNFDFISIYIVVDTF